MAENNYTGSGLSLKWVWSSGVTYFAGDYHSVTISRTTELAETTAGSDSEKTFIASQHHLSVDYTGIYPTTAAGTVLIGALAAGNDGVLYVYPEGTAAGKPVRAYPLISNGPTVSSPYENVVEISCSFTSTGTRPGILIMLDDLSDTNYTNAFPILTAANRRATFFAIQDRVGTTGYATLANLQEIYAAGHDIGNHSKTHTDFRTLTQAEIEAELSSCSTYLIDNGMPRAAKHVAYPYGGYNADVDAAMTDTAMLTGRGTTPTNVLTFDDIHNSTYGLYKLPVGIYVRNTTAAAVKNAIADARNNNQIVILLFHKISDGGTEYECSIADFTEIINYIAATTRVLTISNWFAEYSTLYG